MLRRAQASGSTWIMQLMRPHIVRPAFIECHWPGPFVERDDDVVSDLMIHDLDLVLSFNL
ncbi:MAG: hypothetical protein U0231_14400 [Nitrospiraceae bacterium]